MKSILHMALCCFAVVISHLPNRCLAASTAEDYDFSERCGKRAQEVFDKNTPTPIEKNENGRLISTYSNHYNKKLNKCFISVIVTYISKDEKKSVSYKQVQIYDINDNKEYGVLFTPIDPYFRATSTPIQCIFLEKTCHSEEEWNSLQKPYMEE